MIQNFMFILFLLIMFGCGDKNSNQNNNGSDQIENSSLTSINSSENIINQYLIDGKNSLNFKLSDYQQAGLQGVTAENIQFINSSIENKKVSSIANLQNLINQLLVKQRALNKIINYTKLSNNSYKSSESRRFSNDDIKEIDEKNIPNIQDYIDAGVVGVDKDSLLKLNSIIFNKDTEDINSTIKIQTVGNTSIPKVKILHKLYKYTTDRKKNPSLTVDEYEIIGLTHVNEDNIKSFNSSMLMISPQDTKLFSVDHVKNIETLSMDNKIDMDKDGYSDMNDAFPLDNKEYLDTDKDGIGNNADLDDDNDGVLDTIDDFPLDKDKTLDTDNDGIDNKIDLDDDNDGVLDINDAFPLNSKEHLDTDGDGVGNKQDLDDDNDGILDHNDIFPLDKEESLDSDGDGVGNNQDLDDDNDGILDLEELRQGKNPLIK